ncbi:ATP-dependent RNA helicase dbp2-like [Brachionus plicatilis]|uniref:ATP-dependent RNA helicase dbp2-like n=1 Tax=Brachionus plicatilis TaxID=10195 RepID=A0A3M7T837_BRAPC|nr:ATP-dependent RNA helicase dbp2-like [Brachionus plicatilis]
MYVEHDEVKKRKWFDTEKFLDVHEVKFTGFRCPRPLFKFEHANFPESISKIFANEDGTYPKLTAFQCLCWPILLSGRDLIAVSNSSYGKHFGYAFPLIVHIKNQHAYLDKKGPCAMILTPHQPSKDDILSILKPYLDSAQIRPVCVYESENKNIQIANLKESYDLMIANPTRLLEIINENQNLVDLSHISFLIIDEYIQFRKSQTMDFVKDIVEYLRADRQTAVFSRLVPSGIQRQGDEFVKNCIFFEMHHDKESADDEIKQIVELCDKYLKAIDLVDKLTTDRDCKILIYAKDKEKCLNLNFELKRQLDLEVLDFRKEEHLFVSTPNAIMTTFKNIGLEINIPDLNYIINVDFPPNLQTYMDRLRKGVVHYTFFSREDAKHAERLVYCLKQARQEYDQHLSTMSKAWLECGRDVRFMPMIQELEKGLSKPLQEMILSSGDEEHITGSYKADSFGYGYGRGAMKRSDSQADDMIDDEDDEDDDEEQDEDLGN